jgi:WD40 repeat protein
MTVEHPRQLSDYRILREIGRGGMGIVYEAEQVSLGRRVALKVLLQQPDPLLRQRFEREARAAARLHHTNIVPVFGVGEHDGQPYYVMQFIQGLGLDQVLLELQRLRQARPADPAPAPPRDLSAADVARSLLTGEYQGGGPQTADPEAPAAGSEAVTLVPQPNGAGAPAPQTAVDRPSDSSSPSLLLSGAGHPGGKQQTYWQRVAALGVQVAEALGYAHRQGVLHRDIKPSNLLLDTRGTVWITDFGLAKAQDQENLTQTGEILGTLRYMPPEAYEGKSDARTDQYALGMTLYELLTLRPAFDASDRLVLITRICSEEPVRPRVLDPHMPRDLETIVLKAMEKDPRRRYPTADELAADLQRFLDNEPIRARPLSAGERLGRWCRRHPGIAGLLAALVVVFLAGFAGVTWKWREATWQTERADEARQETLKERNTAVAQREAAQAAEQKARRLLYASDMNVALEAWEEGSLRRAQDLLLRQWPEEGQEDLRDFTWRYLWRLCQGDEKLTLPGPVGPVSFSPDGKTLAVASGNLVRIREVVSGQVLATLTGPTAGIRTIAFSPDGKWLAAGGVDTTVRLWNVAAPQGVAMLPTATLAGHTAAVTSLVFAPDAKTLASAGPDNTVRLWEVASRRQVATLAGGHVLHFCCEGKRLAARGKDGKVLVWDVASRQPLPSPPFSLSGEVKCCAFSPDGTRMALGDTNKKVRLWDVATGKVTELVGHTAWVRGVAFSPDGKRLASCSHDGTAILWDIATGSRIVPLPAHHAQVTAVAFSPDGQLVATGSDDATIKLWNTTTFQQAGILRSPSGYAGTLSFSADDLLRPSGGSLLSFSPDGSTLVSGGREGSLKIWPVVVEADKSVFARHTGWTSSVAFSPDGKLVAAADSHDVSAKLWDAATRKLIARLAGKSGMLWQVAFSPDGKTLATGGDGVRLWDLTALPEVLAPRAEVNVAVANSGWSYLAFSGDGKTLAAGNHNAPATLWDSRGRQRITPLPEKDRTVQCLAFSPVGATVALCRPGGVIRLWDRSAGHEVGKLSGQRGEASCAVFSPRGTQLATGGIDGTVRLWDLSEELPRFVFPGHSTIVLGLAFSPDGKTLATASEDGTVKLWHTEIGQEVGTLKLHRGPVTCAAFSPDGNTLATCGADATIRFCQAAAGEDIRRPQRPSAPEPESTLGEDLAHQGRWQEAAAELARALKGNPANSLAAVYLANALLQTNDVQQYRRLCQDRARDVDISRLDVRDANNTAWLYCLAPDAVTDYKGPVALAQGAVDQSVDDQQRTFMQNTLGAILYRAGRYQDAIRCLSERLAPLKDGGIPQDWVFLAMAHHRLGHQAEAQRWLDKVRSYKPPDVHANPLDFWNDLEIARLRREAEALIAGEQAAPGR